MLGYIAVLGYVCCVGYVCVGVCVLCWGMSGDFWGSQEGCQGPSRPSGHLGFPGDSVVKNLPANEGDVRDVGLIPGLGRSPGEGHGNLLQYSYLENPHGQWTVRDRGVRSVLSEVP